MVKRLYLRHQSIIRARPSSGLVTDYPKVTTMRPRVWDNIMMRAAEADVKRPERRPADHYRGRARSPWFVIWFTV
jgi:hypothetical protein